MCDKPVTNLILSGEGVKVVPSRSVTRQVCPLSPLLFNITLEILASAIRQAKEINSIQVKKGEVKLPLCVHDMILHVKNSKDSTKRLLELINSVKFQEAK